nr:adenylate/guanylate cyclase domain-containing protein [Acinetobacter amyesii]
MIDSIGLESASNSEGKVSTGALDESLKLTIKEPEQYKLQQQIREVFGRGNTLNFSTIADHPDFNSLVHGGVKKQYITTMFVDIKGSTKLSLKYPDSLEFIYKFKNAVIKTCIEVIHAFDGHVHRIMGDAVLGFFGSTKISKEQSILDCINAASMLTVLLEQTIKPWLKSQKEDFDVRDFGFRVGCNFGDDSEVLWGNYGFGAVGEVSPTGLPVDLAAKLQGLANKNQIMMGQGILEFFNFPEDLSEIKSVQENYEDKPVHFVTPNYIKADGSSLNYTMRLLKINKYILGLPLPLQLKRSVTTGISNNEHVIPNHRFELTAEVHDPKGFKKKYISNSEVIKKNSKIIATLNSKNLILGEFLKVIFYKKNHSGFKNEPILEKFLEEEIIKEDIKADGTSTLNIFRGNKTFQRDCNFKGLHYIRCDVLDSKQNVVFRDYIYVPIE